MASEVNLGGLGRPVKLKIAIIKLVCGLLSFWKNKPESSVKVLASPRAFSARQE